MALDKLFYLQGIGDRFIDCSGAERSFSHDERMALLCALMRRDSAPGEQDIAERIEALDAAPWLHVLPGLQHAFVDEPAIELQLPESAFAGMQLPVAQQHEFGSAAANPLHSQHLIELCIRLTGDENSGAKAPASYRLSLTLAQAKEVGDYLRPDGRYIRLRLPLPLELQIGEYQLTATLDWFSQHAFSGELLIVPRRGYQGGLDTSAPSKLSRPWGLGISLFYLRSQRQWGVGDFADLGKLIELGAESGCDFITLTPLHAPSLANTSLISPYSPWDRRFLNPLAIAIDWLPEYAGLSQQFKVGEWLRERLLLNQLAEIDYPKVALLKYRALARLFAAFEAMDELCGRVQRFEAFVKSRGQALESFCQSQLAEAKALGAVSEGVLWWADEALSVVLKTPRFFAWLQFVADEQLEQSQLRCRQVGMRLGLVRDLAVGALGQGSEVSARYQRCAAGPLLQEPAGEAAAAGADELTAFCERLDIGAPPDPFSATGQNWGMPPFDPVALKQSAFQAFRRLCRENMRHCGALRIDHVMAMSRIWCWSPALGGDAAKQAHPEQDGGAGDTRLGCYLHFPADTLLAILTLESHLSRCVLIGEDLGTVPPGLREELKKLGIFGNDLIYFCREGERFIAPAKQRRAALLQLGNQDVPPFIAWWRGLDLQQLDAIGLGREGVLMQRRRDKEALVQALSDEGVLAANALKSDATASDDELAAFDELAVFDALLNWCGRSRAELVGVSLWDLALETRPVNIPGTHNEYPNWRARLSQSLDNLWQSAGFRARLHAIRLGRRGELQPDTVANQGTDV